MGKILFSRRQFTSHLIHGTLLAASPLSLFKGFKSSDNIEWINVEDFGVEGKGWAKTQSYYDRLPSKAESVVRPPVWNLSKDSAGMCFRFKTDSPNIHVRYNLIKESLALPHMPATGVSGLDLYANDGMGMDKWVSVVLPRERKVDSTIAEDLKSGARLYTLYLPLYNGLGSLEIGLDKGAAFEGLSPRRERSILFYGTSIMQGACASRPGLAIPAILGRRFNKPTINLGFSGNGRMEPEVGALLSEMDPCVFAIDCLPNMNHEMVTERAGALVKQLRSVHNDTPILLVEDRSFTNSEFFPQRMDHHKKSRKALRKVYLDLKNEGITNLFYLKGDLLLGLDGNGATDGSHPQ